MYVSINTVKKLVVNCVPGSLLPAVLNILSYR